MTRRDARGARGLARQAFWATLKIGWLLLRGAVYLLALTLGFVARRLDPAP
jgi:hypothetical protein